MSDLILKEAIDNLSDDDVSVRKEAVNALIGVTDIETIDPLIEATTDDNAQIRFKAAEILGNMGEVARDKLIEKFKNKNELCSNRYLGSRCGDELIKVLAEKGVDVTQYMDGE